MCHVLAASKHVLASSSLLSSQIIIISGSCLSIQIKPSSKV